MNLKLERITQADLSTFKAMFQEAFQKGYEDHFGKCLDTILPEKDIDQSLCTKGAIAYKAIIDDEMVGGAIIVINDNQHNDLHLLCVKVSSQNKGIGKAIWFEIEKLHPNTKQWRTCTPCFETRNIHFYTKTCGFQITKKFDDENIPDDFIGDGGQGMFELVKTINN